MKTYFLAVLLTFILFNYKTFSQIVSFPSDWAFKTGDKPFYKQVNYNDSQWEKISVLNYWEGQGYNNYDGYAWYRLHFNIDKKYLSQTLYLLVGKIDDVDETYLNGTLAGATGKMPPNAVSEWNTQRIYKIPAGILKTKNVLAIRVYDQGSNGGIYGGLFGIYNKEGYFKELNLGPAPKKSFYQLVTSNGLIAAVYDQKKDLIENVFPHIFRNYDKDKPVKPFLKQLKLQTNEKPQQVSYLDNTHIIDINYQNFNVNYFAPFTTQKKIFYAVINGKDNIIKNLNFKYQKDYCEVLEETSLEKEDDGNSRKYFLFSFNDSLENHSDDIKTAMKNLAADNIIRNELNYMKDVFAKCYYPKNISADEKNLYQQSISVLKMGQVSQSEIFKKSRGQILASLPPGMWNICWLRDGTYSILALNKLGLFKEAKDALKFYLNADAGYYKHFVYKDGKDYGLKVDYRLSVCRYFGIGKEESDFNENGPNIEIDGFGLFLNAFTDYINKSGDVQFLKDNLTILTKLIADPIVSFIDTNNLIRKDSGPWETHLPGNQFAYTSIECSAGLKNFAEECRSHNIDNYQKYFDAAEKIRGGIKCNLVYENKFIKGFYKAEGPETEGFYDGGTIEAFNNGLFPDKKFFNSYFIQLEKGLRINKNRGFARMNNPDWYSKCEWAFLDLRIASALVKYGNKKESKILIDWITDYSKDNFNLIAELFDYKTENYAGAIPMVGFGAGSYILALCDYLNN